MCDIYSTHVTKITNRCHCCRDGTTFALRLHTLSRWNKDKATIEDLEDDPKGMNCTARRARSWVIACGGSRAYGSGATRRMVACSNA